MQDDDPPHARRSYPLSPSKMSKTPSWVMLGFVLGAVTVWSLPPLRTQKPAAPAISRPALQAARPPSKREPPQLTTIEAVFSEWARYAVWDYDTTEVALWNSDTRGFTDYYEVKRYSDRYYFRTIPNLTRRIISRGKPMPNCPLQFTETEEQYQEWRQHGRSERPLGDYRPLSAFPSATAADPRDSAAPRPEITAPKLEPIAPFEPPPITAPEAKKERGP